MRDFHAVIIGGDLGAYALARELNEAYDIRPILVTAYNPLSIRDSQIVSREHCENASDAPTLVKKLLDIGQRLKNENPDRPLLLLANTDWRIQVLADYREELEKFYIVPIPDSSTIEQVSDKQGFAEIAAQCSMPE